MENFERVHDSITSTGLVFCFVAKFFGIIQFGSVAAVSGFAVLSCRPIRLAPFALTAHPPNWIQTNLAAPRWTKPAGLIIIIQHYDTTV